MYQLICHHTYKWAGMPVDISPYGNDGTGAGGIALPHGATADSGAIRFDLPWHRVIIPLNTAAGERKPVWRSLRALKIQATFRLRQPDPYHRTLIVGDRSFAVMIGPGGFVWGGYLGPDPFVPMPFPTI